MAVKVNNGAALTKITVNGTEMTKVMVNGAEVYSKAGLDRDITGRWYWYEDGNEEISLVRTPASIRFDPLGGQLVLGTASQEQLIDMRSELYGGYQNASFILQDDYTYYWELISPVEYACVYTPDWRHWYLAEGSEICFAFDVDDFVVERIHFDLSAGSESD